MPTAGGRSPTGLCRAGAVVSAITLLGGCGTVASDSPLPGTPSPTSSVSGSTAGPSASASPSGVASSGPDQTTTQTPTGSIGATLSCSTVTPVRVEKVTTEPRRTTEIVTVVSDGRNLTPGTREQTDFETPTLTAPDGRTVTDEPTVEQTARLVDGSSGNRVLLTRPEPPDSGAEATRRPFNAPGTYVVYNSSTPLRVDVIVQCSGQEQRWTFTAEADPALGQVNCAVEPPRSNAVARLVYDNNC